MSTTIFASSVKKFREFMIGLRSDLITIGCITFKNHYHPNLQEASAIRRLYKIYGMNEQIFNTQLLKDYCYARF